MAPVLPGVGGPRPRGTAVLRWHPRLGGWGRSVLEQTGKEGAEGILHGRASGLLPWGGVGGAPSGVQGSVGFVLPRWVPPEEPKPHDAGDNPRHVGDLREDIGGERIYPAHGAAALPHRRCTSPALPGEIYWPYTI